MDIAFPTGVVRSREWMADHPAESRALLRESYGRRPMCLCRPAGIPLYIARRGETYYIARLPLSGRLHAPGCPSYSTLDEREYAQGALVEDEDGGVRILKASWLPEATPQEQGGRSGGRVSAGQVAVPGPKRAVDLGGLLQLLWLRSHFVDWSPARRGRRHYNQVRKFIQEAAEGILIGTAPLSESLYVPERFRGAENVGLSEHAAVANIGTVAGAGLMLAHLKAVKRTQYGYALQAHHFPQALFVAERALARDGGALAHLVAEASVLSSGDHIVMLLQVERAGKRHNLQVRAGGGLTVTEQWLPYGHAGERALILALVDQERRFSVRPRSHRARLQLPYSVLLTDTDPTVAVHVRQPGDDRPSEPQEGAASFEWSSDSAPEMPEPRR